MKSSIVSALAPLLSERALLLSDLHCRELVARAAQAQAQGASSLGVNAQSSAGSGSGAGEIAVLSINGVLTKLPSIEKWIDQVLGLCPCYPLIDELHEALADSTVSRIVLDIDSPGGMVNGSVELADAVAAARRKKRIDAIVRGMCCSGAFWIASQADSIVARPESLCGNIGAYSVLADYQGMLEQLGIDLTLIASGARKGLGADGKVTQELIDETREIIRGTWSQFVAAVAAGRGMDPAKIEALADGRTFLGPAALSAGLIDGLASTLESAIAFNTQTKTENRTMQKISATATATTTTTVPAPAPTAAAAAAANEPTQVSGNEKCRKAFDDASASASKHKDKVRAAYDAHTEMTDEAEADTAASAKRAISALRSAADEATRCADRMEADYGDTDEAEPSAAASTPHTAQGFTKADYVKAFGEEKGLVLFGRELSFADAAAAHVGDLKAAHAAKVAELEGQITALKAENEKLTTRLAAAPGGNQPASFSAEGQPATQNQRADQMPQNLHAWRETLRLPGKN